MPCSSLFSLAQSRTMYRDTLLPSDPTESGLNLCLIKGLNIIFGPAWLCNIFNSLKDKPVKGHDHYRHHLQQYHDDAGEHHDLLLHIQNIHSLQCFTNYDGNHRSLRCHSYLVGNFSSSWQFLLALFNALYFSNTNTQGGAIWTPNVLFLIHLKMEFFHICIYNVFFLHFLRFTLNVAIIILQTK